MRERFQERAESLNAEVGRRAAVTIIRSCFSNCWMSVCARNCASRRLPGSALMRDPNNKRVMAPSISYQYVIDPDDARAALAAFANQPVIGLDTETYWDYGARRNRLSLLQLAAPTGEVIVIDALTAR